MKNLLLLAILIFTLAFTTNDSIAQKAKKPVVTGKVSTLANVITMGTEVLTVETATSMMEKGQPLVLVSGTGKKAKVYFIMNADGSMATKKLAKLADKELEIFGSMSVKNGLNVVSADKISEKAMAPAKK